MRRRTGGRQGVSEWTEGGERTQAHGPSQQCLRRAGLWLCGPGRERDGSGPRGAEGLPWGGGTYVHTYICVHVHSRTRTHMHTGARQLSTTESRTGSRDTGRPKDAARRPATFAPPPVTARPKRSGRRGHGGLLLPGLPLPLSRPAPRPKTSRSPSLPAPLLPAGSGRARALRPLPRPPDRPQPLRPAELWGP